MVAKASKLVVRKDGKIFSNMCLELFQGIGDVLGSSLTNGLQVCKSQLCVPYLKGTEAR